MRKVLNILIMIFLIPLLLGMGGGKKSGEYISPLERTYQSDALKAINELEAAFEEENLFKFMNYVSPSYETTEFTTLKDRVDKDFARFSDIDLDIYVDAINVDVPNESVVIKTHWDRSWIARASEGPATAEGNTDFYFEIKSGKAKLVDSRGDTLFGVTV